MSFPRPHQTSNSTSTTAATTLTPTADSTAYTSESYTSLTTPAGTTARHTHTDPRGTVVTEAHQPQPNGGGWVEQTQIPGQGGEMGGVIQAETGTDGVIARQEYVDPSGAVVIEARQPGLPTQVQAQTNGGGWVEETPYQSETGQSGERFGVVEEQRMVGSLGKEEEKVARQQEREAERVQRDEEREMEVERRYLEAMEEEYAKREGGA